MRIIAGRFRRRKLLTNPGNTTRPFIDRAKVMLFDRIRDRLPGARVADLFCGTGTLGLECLSRGAKSAVFAERDHRAYELLRQNVTALGADKESLCWRVDLSRCSFLPKGDIAWAPYDVVFFDPPYVTAESIRPGDTWYRCLQQLSRPQLTNPGALLVLRTERTAEPVLPPSWVVIEQHEMASMRIVMATRQDSEAIEFAESTAGEMETCESLDSVADDATDYDGLDQDENLDPDEDLDDEELNDDEKAIPGTSQSLNTQSLNMSPSPTEFSQPSERVPFAADERDPANS